MRVCVCRLADLTADEHEPAGQSHDEPAHAEQSPQAYLHHQQQQYKANQQQQQQQKREGDWQQQAQVGEGDEVQGQGQGQQARAQSQLSGAELMAEALGRLCRAATATTKPSRPASPAGSTTSTGTPRHAHHAHTVTRTLPQGSPGPSGAGSSKGHSHRHAHSDAALHPAVATATTSTGPVQSQAAGNSVHAEEEGHAAEAQSSGVGEHSSKGRTMAESSVTGHGLSVSANAGSVSDSQAPPGSSGHSPGNEASSGHAAEKVGAGTAGMLAALHSLDAQSSVHQDAAASGHADAANQQASDTHLPSSLLVASASQSGVDLEQHQDSVTADSAAATAVGNTAAALQPAATAAEADSDAENKSPSGSGSKAVTASQQESPTANGVADSSAVSSSGSPVTPLATFRSSMGRLRSLNAAELQSPNRRKYGRSESRDPGVRVSDHPVGESCVNCHISLCLHVRTHTY